MTPTTTLLGVDQVKAAIRSNWRVTGEIRNDSSLGDAGVPDISGIIIVIRAVRPEVDAHRACAIIGCMCVDLDATTQQLYDVIAAIRL